MKIAFKFTRLALLCLALAVTAACGGTTVQYGDAEDVETVNANWGSTDLQATAQKMTQSLLDSDWIRLAQAKPKIRLREVKNLTNEHIDTKAITDTIRVDLMQSGRVRFLADDGNLDQVFAERDFTESATRRGENKLLTDTDYIISGSVRSITKSSANKKQRDNYYLIIMEMIDPQSGELVWSGKNEIRKTSTKATLGW